MARSRRIPGAGRSTSPHRTAGIAPPPAPHPGKSQGPGHGQGIGIGLYLLSIGQHPGSSSGGVPPAAFPHTPVLDTFTRANNASLGANWSLLNPGGAAGYSSTPLGINGNAAYNPQTAGANKGTAYWNPGTFAGTSEAYATASVLPGDLWGVCARCINTGGISVKCYHVVAAQTTTGTIFRMDGFSTDTSIATVTLPNTPTSGDKIGIRVATVAGNVLVQYWWYNSAAGAWTMPGSFTDTSVNKLTAAGNIGIVIGNANGSSVGRLDDFGGGLS